MADKRKGNTGNGSGREAGAGTHAAGGQSSGGDAISPDQDPGTVAIGGDVPEAAEQIKECQAANLYTLRSVFHAFRQDKKITKGMARAAGAIYRGVSGQVRTVEFGQRE